MTLGTCDACGEPITDAWIALEGFGAAAVACVCPTCAPIVARLDGLVDGGQMDETAAAAAFERDRWPASSAA